MSERSQAIEQEAVRDVAFAFGDNASERAQDDVPSGYKRTEVGVVPEDWSIAPLQELVDFLDSQRRPVKSSDRARMAGIYPYYGASGVVDYVNDYLFDEDLILLGEDGENILSRNLPLAFRVSGKIWVNNHAHVLRPKEGIEIGYLADFLESIDYGEYNSGTAQPKLTRATCASIPIAHPSPEEQRAIATALSDAGALIESLTRLIAKKRAIKQAAMQQLLTGKTRLPGFTGEWEMKRFGDVLERENLKSHQIQTADYRASGKYPVVDQGQEVIVGFTDRDDKVFSCPNTGVIVFGDHTCIVKFINFDFAIGADGTQILQAKPRQCTRFYAYQLEQRGVQPTGYNRHFKFLKEREFWVPHKEEQAAIATLLSDMDAEIEALERRRDKARQIKQGMMQQLLTGRVRLV